MLPSGNVGIGTTSPADKITVNGNIITQGGNTNTGYDRYLKLYGNSDPATNTHRWAGLAVYNNGGNNVNELAFFAGSGDTARTERMRITSLGQIKATPSTSSRAFFSTQDPGNFSIAYTAYMVNASTKVLDVLWYGTTIGSITTNAAGNGVNFNTTSSDERLKKNITKWDENILDKFKDIKPKEFNFNTQEDTEEKIKGYIAQNEVDKFPEAYPLLYNEEAGEDRHMFNPSGMTVYLMKAIQELKADNDSLRARIETLENN
jgi:hypothetical protein